MGDEELLSESDDSSGQNPLLGVLSQLSDNTTTPEAQDYAKRILDRRLGPEQTTQEQEAFKNLKKSAEEARLILQEARKRVLARRYNQRFKSLALIQGMGAPTRSGSIGENAANIAASIEKPLREEQAFQYQNENESDELAGKMAGIDQSLAAQQMQLIGLQRKYDAPLGVEALRTMGRLTAKNQPPKTMSNYGKIALDTLGPQSYGTPEYKALVKKLRDQDLKVHQVTAGMDSTEMTPEEKQAIAKQNGVPVAPVDPYAGLSTKSKAAQQQIDLRNSEKAIELANAEVPLAQAGIQKANRFMKLNSRFSTGAMQGAPGPIGSTVRWATGFGAAAKEMDAISADLSRKMRVVGEGSTSDFDAKQFLSATVGRDKPYTANSNISKAFKAAQQLKIDHAQFLNDYLSVNRHLRGAQSEWLKYLNDNPIFDPTQEGTYELNKSRLSYQQYFGSEGHAEGGKIGSAVRAIEKLSGKGQVDDHEIQRMTRGTSALKINPADREKLAQLSLLYQEALHSKSPDLDSHRGNLLNRLLEQYLNPEASVRPIPTDVDLRSLGKSSPPPVRTDSELVPGAHGDQSSTPILDDFLKKGFAEGGEVGEPEDNSQILRMALQGATLGGGDEAMAALQTLGGGASYDQNVKQERAKILKSEETSPLTSLAAQTTGGGVSLYALGVAAARSMGLSNAAIKLLPHSEILRLALLGLSAGGVSGALKGEEGDRFDQALQTGLIGLVGGPLGGLATKYGVNAAGSLLDKARGRQITGGERRLIDALSADAGSPRAAIERVRAERRKGLPSELLDVTGPRTKALTEAALMTGGDESEALGQELNDRAAGSRERVSGVVNKALKPDEYFSRQDQLKETLSKNAAPMYQQAYEQFPSISSPKLMQVLQTPDGQRAVRMAMRLARNKQMNVDPQMQNISPLQQLEQEAKSKGYFESEEAPSPQRAKEEMEWLSRYNAAKADPAAQVAKDVPPGLPLEFYDYVKRGFDQLISKEETNGRGTTLGHSLRDLRSGLRGELDTATTVDGKESPYKAARQQYAGDLEVLDALHSGREEFSRMTPEQVRRQISEMSFAEKDAYRSGVAQALFEALDKPTTDINAARKVIGSPATTEKLKALFDTPAQFGVFKSALDRELSIYEKSKKLAGTAERANTARAAKTGSVLENVDPHLHSVPWGFTPVTWTLNLLRMKPKMSEETANQISAAMKSKSLPELNEMAKTLEEKATRIRVRKGRAGKAAAVGAIVSSSLLGPTPKGKNLQSDEENSDE